MNQPIYFLQTEDNNLTIFIIRMNEYIKKELEKRENESNLGLNQLIVELFKKIDNST